MLTYGISNNSAVQIVPKIVDSVKTLHVYGRSPAYITPLPNASYSALWRWLFRRVPLLHRLYCFLWYYVLDSTFPIYCKPAWYSLLHRAITSIVVRWYLFLKVSDPELRKKLTPNRSLGNRRTVISTGYYDAVQKKNVEYHRGHISKIQGNIITLEDGSTQELEVLILATGFDTSFNFPVGLWTGRGGIDMSTHWSKSAMTYFGVCAPNAPNFFMGWGPQSGSRKYHQRHRGASRLFLKRCFKELPLIALSI